MGEPNGRIHIDAARNGTAVGVALRPENGLHWLMGRAEIDDPPSDLDQSGASDEPFLVGSAIGWTPYAVLRHARLADEFEVVGSDPTPERVVAFANRYGWLGSPAPFWATWPEAPAGARRLWHGESHRFWKVESMTFHDLRTIWRASRDLRIARSEPDSSEMQPSDDEQDMTEAEAREVLSDAIDVSENMVVRRRPLGRTDGDQPHSGAPIRVVDRATWSYIRKAPAAGLFVVCHEINERLQGHVNPVLLPFRGADQVLVPDTLLAAIYWRFAAEVSADSRHPMSRPCDNPECLNWVAGRPNQKHCSVYCGNRLRDLKRSGRAPNV